MSAGADGHLVKRNASGVTTEYSRWQSTKVSSTIAAAHANGDKFVLTVEGMAWDTGGATAVRTLLSSPAARATLVADIVNEIKTRDLDGVSLDFEPILSDQRDNFASLLHELRSGLDAVNPRYQLTFAATGSQSAQTLSMFGAVTSAGAADAVIIMGYPLRSLDAAYAGGLAPLTSPLVFDLKQITNSYVKSVAPGHIVMALPWYGREWPTVSSAVNAAVQQNTSLYGRPHNIDYADAVQLAAQYGRQLDSTEMSAYTSFRTTAGAGCPQTWMQVYYDDVDTFRAKLDYVSSTGLAGVGIFALGYDNSQPELWKVLEVKYRGLVDRTPPTGQVTLASGTTVCTPTNAATLTLNASDGASGSGAVYVRVSNAPTTDPDGTLSLGRTYPATGQITWRLDDPTVGGTTGFGTRTVYAQWRDVAGNWSVPTSTSINVVPPPTATVTVASGAQDTTSATVPILVTQTGGRAIAKVLVSSSSATKSGVLAHGMTINAGTSTQFSLTNATYGGQDVDGTHGVYVQWQDSAGCWSDVVDSAIVLDRVAPSGSLTIANGATISVDGNVQLLAPATDATSGVATLELSNDGLTWTALAPTSSSFIWSSGSLPDGTWTVRARWRDRAGNVSAAQTASLTLATSAPTGTISINGGAPFTSATSVTVLAAGGPSAVRMLLSNDPTLVSGVLSTGGLFDPSTTVTWDLSATLETVPDGPRTVYAQWQNASGAWSPVASATITLDRTSPVVAVPYPALVAGTTLGTTTVGVDFVAHATDALSGIAHVSNQYLRTGGTWSAVPQNLAPSSADLQIDRTSTWQLQSSAGDVAGNESASVTSRAFRALVTEDTSTAITYSADWTRSLSSVYGYTHVATKRGATATYSFTGSSVAWVAPVGPLCGKAKVYVDGNLAARVDLGRAAQTRLVVFSKTWATSGSHRIRIYVVGTAGRPRVDVDAFVVLA